MDTFMGFLKHSGYLRLRISCICNMDITNSHELSDPPQNNHAGTHDSRLTIDEGHV